MKALRHIPPVNEVLNRPELVDLSDALSQPLAIRLLDEVMGEVRERLRNGKSEQSREALTRDIALTLKQRIEAFLVPSLKRVINATGVILHTNLGRAPLSQSTLDHVREVSTGYSNLEFDVGGGNRGKRDEHVSRLIRALIGCESAIVVNNNAAAVLLVLNALAEGGEVLVSRGEEIEIGGSFRIPEVMSKSGARLREIGTTNRTRIEDYQAAIGPDTRLLLRVHPSNFKVVGFTERPSLAEFISLGQKTGVPTFEDIGSGCVADLASIGIANEPGPEKSIALGIDLICFSGDKLLGGPQAGIIAGRASFVDQVRRNPLFRALRVDKLTLSALEFVLVAHLKGDLNDIPVWRMLQASENELRDRAEALALRASNRAVTPVSLKSIVGGGSVPEAEFPSWGLCVAPKELTAVRLERILREANPPVIVRIEEDRVLIDLRTVDRKEEDFILDVLSQAIAE